MRANVPTQQSHVIFPTALTLLFLAVFAFVARPHAPIHIFAADTETATVSAFPVPGVKPDSLEYAWGAVALLHGTYVVDYDGNPHVPRYPPGFAALLTPAVALAGLQGVVWVPFASALLVGAIAAVLVARYVGPWGAPVAVAATLCAIGPLAYAHLVMSDVPSIALALVDLALLVVAIRDARVVVLAGLIAGALVWLRAANVVLIVAGIAALWGTPGWRRKAALFSLAAVGPLLLLAAWQYRWFGSPFLSGYQALRLNPDQSESLRSFFSWRYAVLGPAKRSPQIFGWVLPNAALYSLALLGFDLFLGLPIVPLVGLAVLPRLHREGGRVAAMARYTAITVVGSLVLYLPYFYQDERFLMLPAALANLMAALWLTPRLLAGLEWGQQSWRRWKPRTLAATRSNRAR